MIEAVGETRVKQYRDFTVVVGYNKEYIVENGSCDCEDSQYNLDSESDTELCWHVIAVKIAQALNLVDDHDLWYSDVNEFL